MYVAPSPRDRPSRRCETDGGLSTWTQTAPVVAVRTPFYELVYHLLDAQWRYFFSVTSGAAAALSAVAGPEQAAARAAQFTALLQVVAGALQTTDLEVFQLNLAHLQRLNETRKLYQRVRRERRERRERRGSAGSAGEAPGAPGAPGARSDRGATRVLMRVFVRRTLRTCSGPRCCRPF